MENLTNRDASYRPFLSLELASLFFTHPVALIGTEISERMKEKMEKKKKKEDTRKALESSMR